MIHVENLVKTFGEVKAVDGVSFDVAAGEIFAFLGPNGAGKTTTIQMLTTLLTPTSGKSRNQLWTLQNMQGFQLIMNFLVMPIFFLSGALFPLTNLPTALAIVTRLDPLTYGIDGRGGALIGTSHFAMATNVSVLVAVAAVFLALGASSFSKIQI